MFSFCPPEPQKYSVSEGESENKPSKQLIMYQIVVADYFHYIISALVVLKAVSVMMYQGKCWSNKINKKDKNLRDN